MDAGIRAHSRLTTLHLADGGFVDNLKQRFGFGGPPESVSEKYARQDRERAARAAAKAPAPAPAPEGKPDAAARLGGINMDALKRREEAAGLKHGGTVPRQGGVIRGPGTGRSDSIPAKMKPGSFVLPADSTKRLSDVRVSNGESSFPPEVVQRIGAAALLAMRDTTHRPSRQAVRGTQRLESGDEVKPQVAAPPPPPAPEPSAPAAAPAGNSFGDAAAFAQDPSVRQVGASPSDSSFGTQLSRVGGAIVDGLGEAAKAVTSYPTSADGKGYGLSRAIDSTTPFSSSASTGATLGGPQQQPWSDARNGTGGYDARPASAEAGASPTPAPNPNNITREGNSYSGGPNITEAGLTINGRAPGGGGSISAQNESAANALDARERLSSLGRVEAAGGGAGGADGRTLGSQVGWAGDPKNPQVYTKTAEDRLGTYGNMNITPGMYSDKYGRAALEQRLGREQANINAGQKDATNRYATDQAAATARAGNALSAQRSAADQALASKRFGLDSQAAGLDARSKMNSLNAQDAVLNAKTPQERAAAQAQLQALSGHPPAPRFTVLKGEKTADGQSADYAINNSTGEFLRPPAPQRTAPPGAIDMLRKNPKMAAQFDAYYGPGSSGQYLGGR